MISATINRAITKAKTALLRRGFMDRHGLYANLNKVRPDDLFVCSFPKSGNTWVRFIIANLLAPDAEISFRNVDQYVVDLHKNRKTIDLMTGRRFIKTHFACFDQYPKMIYVVRDGRDALVSYYYYHGQRGEAGSFRQFLNSGLHTKFGKWSDHVCQALAFSRREPERVLILQYEKMLADPIEATRAIAAFCDIQADDAQLERVRQATAFNTLKKSEQKHGGEKANPDKLFFRKGRKEQWREFFKDDDYASFIDADDVAVLNRHFDYRYPSQMDT